MIQRENHGPTMLLILDGFGYRKEREGNAVASANMPNWQKWLTIYPNRLLNAAGSTVGLLDNCMGNSEVGHICIGSGRIIKTSLVKFHQTIKNKSFFKNELLIKNFEKLKKENKSLHLIGLLSDAGVHSHQFHLHALILLAKQIGLQKVLIHPFLDGRDSPAKSAAVYLKQLENFCKKLNCGKIATLSGRFYAMDRDNNWDRIKTCYDILTTEQNNPEQTWQQALQSSYKNNITDEFFKPIQLIKDGTIKKEDGVVFFNFRPDRAQQLTESFINPKFNHFPIKNLNSTNNILSFFITTTKYKEEFKKFNNDILFEKEKIEHTLLDEISEQTNKKIFVIAETEKYAHVTYFFRGMSEKHLINETYKLIPSIKAKDYVDHPEMSAQKITDEILQSLKTAPAYFYLVNYANPDMVGHSSNFDATVKACEFVDKQLGKLYEQIVEKMNGTIFITADHGNAEEPKTSHTTNPVVFMVINKNLKHPEKDIKYEKPEFGLSNIAPTILKYLGLNIPKEMEIPCKFRIIP